VTCGIYISAECFRFSMNSCLYIYFDDYHGKIRHIQALRLIYTELIEGGISNKHIQALRLIYTELIERAISNKQTLDFILKHILLIVLINI
jgi:hypothetical protein